MTLRRLLQAARHRLAANHDPGAAPQLEAELLLAQTLGVDRAYLFAHANDEAPEGVESTFQRLVGRRSRGEPLAYITGEQEFWSLPLKVNPAVLIPRPETELLVELVLERLPEAPDTRVADIGTGSGAIALAIASERPEAEVHAVDLSAEAIAVAQGNAKALGLSAVTFHTGSWCDPLDGPFDVIASNPPYVNVNDEHLLTGDLRFEPRLALTPGEDELSAFRAIAKGAAACLNPGGWLMFEHGYAQGEAVRGLLERTGWGAVATHQDLARKDRVTVARRAAMPQQTD
ncbi:MAG: peptide chain release factor N(5)-glutamine methyltransferase [Pseudomonadota bacterium]